MIRHRAADFILMTGAVLLAIWLWSCAPSISLESLGPIWPMLGSMIAGYTLALKNVKSTVKRADTGNRLAQRALDLLFGDQPEPTRQIVRKHHNDNRHDRRVTKKKPATKRVIRRAS